MEKEINTTRRRIGRAANVFLAASIAVGGLEASATDANNAPKNESDINTKNPPTILNDRMQGFNRDSVSNGSINVILDNSPGHRMAGFKPSSAPSKSPGSQATGERFTQKLLELNKTPPLDRIVYSLKEHPQLFSKNKIEDVKMYYPIYEAVAQKYDLPWYLLWIIHEAESNASRSVGAFDGQSAPYFGGMQRDPRVWDQAYVDKASEGLSYLEELPQRHKSDWMEIAAAGSELHNNIKQDLSQGASLNESILFALKRYSAEGPAYSRYELLKLYEKILPEKVQ